MSKGLGKLQTDILGLILATIGAHEMFDMRRIERDLRKLRDRDGLAAVCAFSRAVRTLETRGLIEFPSIVPMERSVGKWRAVECADGTFLFCPNDRQRRFGRVLCISRNLVNTYYKGLVLVEQIAEADRKKEAWLDAWVAGALSRPTATI